MISTEKFSASSRREAALLFGPTGLHELQVAYLAWLKNTRSGRGEARSVLTEGLQHEASQERGEGEEAGVLGAATQ